MPIRIYCSFGQLLLLFYKMDSQSRETVEQTKKTIKNSKKKWTDDEVQNLNELLVIPRPLVSSSSSESSNSTITKALNICLSAMIASEKKLSKASQSQAINKVINFYILHNLQKLLFKGIPRKISENSLKHTPGRKLY